jgi:hypothetical protein
MNLYSICHRFKLVEPVIDVDLDNINCEHEHVQEEVNKPDQMEIETCNSPLVVDEINDGL